ncbi:hypothetical protein CRG98_029702 [Punica granatum]|uniref:Uncharacterized protein n=1 Tax=Punica granatum TaxID=22663 RepID=A0A2I0J107_PUNGR|nr:hypothetical protein CRG98_029702 [Punica granatum]
MQIFSFGSLVKNFILTMQVGPALGGLDRGPLGLLLATHGHIGRSSTMPQQLCQLFDAPIYFGPFSSGCRRAATLGRLSWKLDSCALGSQTSRFYGLESTFVGAHMRATESRGLGVSTFPRGRVTDTCEKESPLPVYDPKVEGSCVDRVYG